VWLQNSHINNEHGLLCEEKYLDRRKPLSLVIINVNKALDLVRPYKINYLVLRPACIYSNGAAWPILLLFS
jgi:hypothetical protein